MSHPHAGAQLGSRQCGAGHSPSGHVPGWGGAKTGLSRTQASHEVPIVRAPPSTQHSRRRQRGLSHRRSLLPTVFTKSHLQSTGRGLGATSEQGMAGRCRASVRRHQGSPPIAAHRQATRGSGGKPTGSVTRAISAARTQQSWLPHCVRKDGERAQP